MFAEIKNEFMSMISTELIEKISRMPSNEIAKCVELIYDIETENIEKVYTDSMGDFNRLTVVYKEDRYMTMTSDVCMINRKVYHITLVPSCLLSINDENAINVSKTVINYVSRRVGLIIQKYDRITKAISNNTFDLITLQAIPVITCAIMREIYSGQGLDKVIYLSLCNLIPMYKETSSEEGINSILNLFDEGLGINELIDSGFICSILPDDNKYPGIWGNKKDEVKEEDKKEEDDSESEKVETNSLYGFQIPQEILEEFYKNNSNEEEE